ncbi:uncharacterized protein EI90DRAFT_2328425 [Cantharellus anzutake]|uniref:uncharacterized protein n=1 Tax=Cantharellus anzutake TaxID=1750568 RepID=UPI0019042473|nr:uncharacterized protein EI90DRAFT_2328425 [Cantharellus anzutake]KAF8324590.1 hypothetical protein EI90DRAFT_2328425 [Cantharellus anzutake]
MYYPPMQGRRLIFICPRKRTAVRSMIFATSAINASVLHVPLCYYHYTDCSVYAVVLLPPVVVVLVLVTALLLKRRSGNLPHGFHYRVCIFDPKSVKGGRGRSPSAFLYKYQNLSFFS